MQKFSVGGADFAYQAIADMAASSPTHLIWAHGWGQDHSVFLPIANALNRGFNHTLVDLPGFGQSAKPASTWGTAEYADAFADWLSTLPRTRRIWIGHSFGCRIGLQLAARHPNSIDGLFLIAAAGLPRSRTLAQRLKIGIKLRTFKTLKLFASLGIDTASIGQKFGSADYRNAGPMKDIFVKVVREDLTAVARQVRCKTHLIYGALDSETPPEIGERFASLIPNATLSVLPRLDHYSILVGGRHQVQHQLEQFVAGDWP
jgi:pimeloyl-ACP methyl ester carboxylesterase